jgi:hypothetical protein
MGKFSPVLDNRTAEQDLRSRRYGAKGVLPDRSRHGDRSMSPRLWPQAARQHDHAPFRSAECLAEELEETLERQLEGSVRAEAVAGELAGLRARGAAPLKEGSLPGTLAYRAGFLGGQLLASLMHDGRPLPPQMLVCGVAYGQALVVPSTQEMLDLPAPENANAAHAVAWQQATAKSGRIDPDLRRATFGWLCDNLGVTVSSRRQAALEDKWREREACRERSQAARVLGRRAPVAAIRVTVEPAQGLAWAGRGGEADGAPSFAFDMAEKAWRAAQARRRDPSANPLTDPDMRGFLELRVGDMAVLSKTQVSLFGAACGLAHARAHGFPYEHPVCVVDDCTGTWALHMVRDPAQPVVQVTEIYGGASAPLPLGTLADLIDVFVARFANEAVRRIPDLTDWGELAVLGGYLPE